MNLRQWFRELRSVTFAALVVSSASLFTTSAITAQAPTTAVGTASAPQTATVTITTAGTLASTSVLTQGSTTLDYALYTPGAPVAGSCALQAYNVGDTCTVQYTFTPTRPFTRYGAVSLFDGSGNLLGNTFLTGVGTGPQVDHPLGASSAPSVLGSGFSTPYGVAVDAAGNVYVADPTSNSVKEILASNGTVVTLGSGFSSPAALAVDGAGNVYVADSGNHAIKEIIAVNGIVPPAPASPTIVVLSNAFNNPQGVAVDGAGNVYVADAGGAAVYELAAVNGVVPAASTPASIGAAGSFSAPGSVAVDATGNVYVTDSPKSSVLEIVASAGVVSSSSTVQLLGNGLSNPQGVAVDGSGNVYVSDLGHSAIKEFLAVGGSVPTGTITIVSLGSGYSNPTGVAVDASGDVFVADSGNGAVEELNAQTPPTLSFAQTVLGSTSTDSPKTVTIANIGNTALLFGIPGSGTNPAISTNFSISGVGTTCPQLTTTTGSLAAGASCVDAVSFTPVMAGTISGSLVSTDTNLNASSATQTVTLGGVATSGTPVVTIGTATASVDANSTTLSASVSYAGVAPTGAFAFTVNSGAPIAASCTGSASPQTCTATYNPSSLTVASYPVTGTIATDSNYATASGNGTLTITQGTPTLSLSAGGTSTVDNTVTFTAMVTPNSGIIPTGKVTFTTTLAGTTTTLCSSVSLVNAASLTATCTTSALAAGSNSIGATLTGDTNFTSQSATPVTQTVNSAPTTLATTSSLPVGSAVDTAVTFTAQLSATQPFTIKPTGTVTFSLVGGSVIPGCANVGISSTNQQAACTAYALVAPSDTIVATYNADANFQGSTAPSITQIVSKSTPVTTVTNFAVAPYVDGILSYTATITPANNSGAGVTPSGSVTLTKGSTGGPAVCSQPAVVTAGANGTGTATCQGFFNSAFSNVQIYASYSGDTNFNAGTAGTVAQYVNAAPTTTSVTSSANPSSVNQGINLGILVTPTNSGVNYPGTATPQSGTFTISDLLAPATIPTQICSGTYSGGAITTSTCSNYIFTSAGSHVLTAAFTSSDANFTSSTTNNSTTQVVSNSNLILTLSNTGSTTSTVNQSTTYAATFGTFTTGQTVPQGTVAYFDSLVGTTAICTVTISGTGTIPNCTETLLVAGLHNITATYTPATGSSFNTTNSQTLGQTVNQSATTVAITAPTVSPTVDQVVTFTATVTPSVASPGTTLPTGTIAFTAVLGSSNYTLCTATLASTGATSASCTAPFLAAGSYTITATYSGDKNFTAPGTAPTKPAFSVGVTGTSLGLASSSLSSPSQPAVNQSALYTVQLTLANSISDTNLTTPSKSVTLTDAANSAISCTAPLALNGQAQCSLTELTAGPHSITATYPTGDANFGTSTTTFPVTIVASGTSIAASSITTSPTSVSVNQTGVFLNAVLTPVYSGAALPNGSIVFTDTVNSTSCSSTVTNGVSAGCTHVFASSGPHVVTAVFNPIDNNFSASTSVSNTITVSASGSTTIAISAPATAPTTNTTAIFTAAFSAPPVGGSNPTGGTVTYYDAGSAISTCTNLALGASSSSIPSCSEFMTSAGTHSITISYAPPTGSSFSAIPAGGALAELVNKSATAVAITAPTATTVDSVDQAEFFIATVTPSALGTGVTNTVPTGSVTFTYYGISGAAQTSVPSSTPLTCTVQVVAGTNVATATCPVTLGYAGSYNISAVYAGDQNFTAPASTSTPEAVTKTGTSLTIFPASSVPSPQINVPITFTPALTTAISSVGLTTPTGSVTIVDQTNSNAAVCTALITNGVVATCAPYTFTTAGTHTLLATYVADGNFSGSTSNPSVTVVQSSTSIAANSITATPTNPTVNQTGVTLGATLASGNSGTTLPTGKVTFTDSVTGATACVSTIANGVVPACAYVFATAGAHTITAAYSGDTNFSAVSNSNTVTVGKATPGVVVVSAIPTGVPTQALSFTATVTPSPTGVAPTGSVAFTLSPPASTGNATVTASCTLSPSGTSGAASCTITQTFPATTVGTSYSVTGLYSGDTNYASNSSSPITEALQSFAISLSQTAITVAQSNTNVSDPYFTNTNAIVYTSSPQNGFGDTVTPSCTGSVAGLTCTVTGTALNTAGGLGVVTVSASSSVLPGNYTVTVTTADNSALHTTLSQVATVAVTVIAQSFSAGTTGYTVPAAGKISIPITIQSGAAVAPLTCDSLVATLATNGTTYTTSTNLTLADIGVQCTSITASGSTSTTNSYTVAIQTGSGSYNASLQRGPLNLNRSGIMLAGMAAPFLLLIGLSPSARRHRKALRRILALAFVAILALQATGCSGNGFARNTQTVTTASPGSYVIAIQNSATPKPVVVAEIPLTIIVQ